MLYFIGLGLGDEKDITVRGLEAVKRCTKVVLERYTSVLGVDKEKLEAFYGRPVTYADRYVKKKHAQSLPAACQLCCCALMRTCHHYILSVCNNQRFTRYWHWAILI
jgi:diphthamide biosynthesis methyltransferase